MINLAIEPPNSKWTDLSSHRVWLLREAEALFSFFEGKTINPLGGFHDLDDEGRPTASGYGAAGKPARYLFSTTRIIYAFSIAYLMGRPGADIIAKWISYGMAIATRSMEATIGASAMTRRRTAPSRHMVTLSSCWPRQAPKWRATQTPTDFGNSAAANWIGFPSARRRYLPGSGGRVGQREGWLLLYAGLGRHAANTRSLFAAVQRRDRGERIS